MTTASWLAVAVLGALTSGTALVRRLATAGYRLDDEKAPAVPRWWRGLAMVVLVLLWGAATVRFHDVDVPVMAALWTFAVLTVALAWVDADVHRLPSGLIWPGLLGVGVQLLWAAVAAGAWGAFARAVVGGIAMFVLHLALALLAQRLMGGGFGGGDVNLAALTGLVTGYVGWTQVVVAVYASFLLAGGYALVRVLLRRAGRRTAIAFGPWMLAGAWVAVLVDVAPAF